MPAPPLSPALLKAHHKDFPRRPASSQNQLASSVAFPDQLCIGQLAEMRADRFNVDVLVSVFPGIVHQGDGSARRGALWRKALCLASRDAPIARCSSAS
jgi:hypothetical protein